MNQIIKIYNEVSYKLKNLWNITENGKKSYFLIKKMLDIFYIIMLFLIKIKNIIFQKRKN